MAVSKSLHANSSMLLCVGSFVCAGLTVDSSLQPNEVFVLGMSVSVDSLWLSSALLLFVP